MIFGALFVVGLVTGLINVLAGGGSFISLPALLELGLAGPVANGTNRVCILLGNLTGTRAFLKAGLLEKSDLPRIVAPACVGALIGSLVATQMDDRSFRGVLALLMIVVSLYTLLRADPKGELKDRPSLLAPGFFLVGLYAGFIQAGTGFLALAVSTAAGLQLVRGNAVKTAMNFALTMVALSVFWWHGQVHWLYGGVLAAGGAIGGHLGARATVLKGNRWLKRVVTLTIVLIAIYMVYDLYRESYPS